MSKHKGLEQVEKLFREQIESQRLHPGAALAVYHRGELVLDLQAGFSDTQQGRLLRPDNLFVLFSATKPLAAAALLQLVERGRAGLDDPVAEHWPEFAAQGKERITLRHLLTHRAGLWALPDEVSWRDWSDWTHMTGAIAAMAPLDEPGGRAAYHAMSFGWLVGEVVQRLARRPFSDYLREEITAPLGMHDTFVGLPDSELPRVSKLHAMEDASREGCGTVRIFNGRLLQQGVIPAANGISTARDMARFYAMLCSGGALDGTRVLQQDTVERFVAPEGPPARDRVFGHAVQRGLGVELGGVLQLGDRKGQHATGRTFGHGGVGTSIAWGDADLDVGMAFIPNGYREGLDMVHRCRDLSDAVRAACGEKHDGEGA